MAGMFAEVRRGALSAAKSTGAAFLDCFLPQFCAICRKRTTSDLKLCAACAGLVRPSPFAYCPLCRFEGERTEGACPPGSGCPIHVTVKGLAALHTDEPILQLVHRFKYSRERGLVPTLAGLMLSAAVTDPRLGTYDMMCPVPLYRARLRERGFNQSAELGRFVERPLGVPFIADLLVKKEPTPEQARLAGRARRRNLQGCFGVTRPEVLHDKDVILIDDLLTTGSTASACIEALTAAGAKRVAVLTVAA